MNLKDAKFKDFSLVQEMLETPAIIKKFDYDRLEEVVAAVKQSGKLMMTGEGSSRIFPAKNFLAEALKSGLSIQMAAEGARQAHEYDLSSYTVLGVSNSGQTKELISLFSKLKENGHSRRFGLTAHPGTKLEDVSNRCFQLDCGPEKAVAATKSVVEQGLFYQSLLCNLAAERGGNALRQNQEIAAEAAREVLEMNLDTEMVRAMAGAGMLYFAGRNNGVAEELTLKTNEITRKKSDFLEGTYAVHGIEEVMDCTDVLIIVDPYPSEEEKFKQCLADGIGMKVFAMANRDTLFPTIRIPHIWGYDTFLQLLAGWNVLVHIGIYNGINLDKPARARKVGNEFVG